MTLPTKQTASGRIPSRVKLSRAARSVVYNRDETWSVSTRLISSGMLRSPLRSPASTCMTGMSFFTAVSAQAMVELTSPTTSTAAGRCWSRTGSKRCMIALVCMAWVPEPTPKSMSGSGMPSCSKNCTFMLAS